MQPHVSTIPVNISIPENIQLLQGFESSYIALRQKEQRLYSNEALLNLPNVSQAHPHHQEWRLRKKSADKLVQRLSKKKQPLHILEVGCGNGWLAKQLAGIAESNVIGCDINFSELQQAAVVFESLPNLHFIYGDIRGGLFAEKNFDVIIFAASIQYFPSLQQIIASALALLKPAGELHILDSPFYNKADVMAARQRTADYYTSAGFPAMASHYFHHSWSDLQSADYELLYNPASLLSYFSINKIPFPWICIRSRNRYV